MTPDGVCRRRSVLAALILALPGAAQGQPLGLPEGEVVLTVRGAIAETNRAGTAVFDQAMLAEIGTVSFTTTTIWTEGEQVFTGTPLHLLAERLGIDTGDLVATALNDYTVTIPVSDAVEGGPIIAFARNGLPMSVRDKGPLWIVYPYESDSAYSTEQIYARSIWHLVKIDVVR